MDSALLEYHMKKYLQTLNLKICRYFYLAEKPGFEPGRRSSRPTPLAGEPLRPLGYFSRPIIWNQSLGYPITKKRNCQ